MSKRAIPTIDIMNMIGASGGARKCSKNYVSKHAVNNNIHI
jgi:hypothetical protein